MEITRSPYRPNVRRLTSPRTQRRIRFDILSAWAGAGISMHRGIGSRSAAGYLN